MALYLVWGIRIYMLNGRLWNMHTIHGVLLRHGRLAHLLDALNMANDALLQIMRTLEISRKRTRSAALRE
jgi:hypothetical protein